MRLCCTFKVSLFIQFTRSWRQRVCLFSANYPSMKIFLFWLPCKSLISVPANRVNRRSDPQPSLWLNGRHQTKVGVCVLSHRGCVNCISASDDPSSIFDVKLIICICPGRLIRVRTSWRLPLRLRSRPLWWMSAAADGVVSRHTMYGLYSVISQREEHNTIKTNSFHGRVVCFP